MKFVIPAKTNSIRVKNKNFRDFYNGKSLVEILIEKLIFVGSENIYISCENEIYSNLADKYKCNFILRENRLTDNDTPFEEIFKNVYNQIPNDDEYAWCQVTDPLFCDYKKAIDLWDKNKEKHDSLTVVYPFKKYLLNSEFKPLNFGFGPWHIKSQELSLHFDLTYTFSIIKKETLIKCGYHFGKNPVWYQAKNNHIDIDTEEDFELAQFLYQKKNDKL
jgi:N-acylneuraminate cytidylyltransferase